MFTYQDNCKSTIMVKIISAWQLGPSSRDFFTLKHKVSQFYPGTLNLAGDGPPIWFHAFANNFQNVSYTLLVENEEGGEW